MKILSGPSNPLVCKVRKAGLMMSKSKCVYEQNCHNHTLQINPWHREEETYSI